MLTPPLLPPQNHVAKPASKPKTQYTLTVLGDTFVVRNGARKETVPRVVREAKTKETLVFRKDKRWVVWDERGLTTRDGDWTVTDRLEAVPISAKAQGKAAIKETVAAVKAGKRTRAAAGLSGARRLGTLVYLLPRWEDEDRNPWLEALIVVDLAKPHPKARLIGTFDGISLARKPVEDRLGLVGGLLTVPVNGDDAWGVATYDPKKSKFGFRPRGVELLALEPDGRIIEKTAYGTTLAGRQDDGRTIPWLETRGPAEFVPGPGPILVRCRDRLRNAVTGAEFKLAPGASVRRTNAGLLVFWPEVAPRSARLVEPSRFEERARWERGVRR